MLPRENPDAPAHQSLPLPVLLCSFYNPESKRRRGTGEERRPERSVHSSLAPEAPGSVGLPYVPALSLGVNKTGTAGSFWF